MVMANITVATATPPPPPPQVKVTMTLTPEEAKAFQVFCGRLCHRAVKEIMAAASKPVDSGEVDLAYEVTSSLYYTLSAK